MIEGLRDAQARIAAIQARFETARWDFAPGFEPAYEATGIAPTVGLAGTDAPSAAPDAAAVASQQALLGATFGIGRSTLTQDDGAWIRRLPERGREWAGAIADAARAHGLEPGLLAAVAWSESDFDPDAVSPAGATGLLQLMPTTAQRLGVDATQPLQNLAGGARELGQLVEDADGDVAIALASYHAGPETAFGPRDQWPNSTTAYVATVLERRDLVLGRTTAPEGDSP